MPSGCAEVEPRRQDKAEPSPTQGFRRSGEELVNVWYERALPLHFRPNGGVRHRLETVDQPVHLLGIGYFAHAHILMKSRAIGPEGRGTGLKQYVAIQLQRFNREVGSFSIDVGQAVNARGSGPPSAAARG